jgi:hypothetical protein
MQATIEICTVEIHRAEICTAEIGTFEKLQLKCLGSTAEICRLQLKYA